MKNSFIYDGKKYISSKRASKISDYSSDYIGQLCRSGKLAARMVGHTWFVSEDSLNSHRQNILSGAAFEGRIENIRHASRSVSSDSIGAGPVAGRLSTKEASEISGYTSDYIGQLCRGAKLDARMIGNAWMITEDSLRAHMAKTVAALVHDPAEEKIVEKVEETASVEIRADKPSLVRVAGAPIANVVAPAPRRPVRSTFMRRALMPAVVVAVVAIAVTVSIGGYNRPLTMNVPAAVLTGSVGQSTGSAHTSAGDSSAPDTSRGLAVVPSSGSTATDEQMKTDIRNSFSDQVSVAADKSGTAGVITPVFKEAKGKDFIYVMVPVNGAQTP